MEQEWKTRYSWLFPCKTMVRMSSHKPIAKGSTAEQVARSLMVEAFGRTTPNDAVTIVNARLLTSDKLKLINSD